MPSVAQHAAGDFCWFELATSDQAAANSFYASLFGWSANDLPLGPLLAAIDDAYQAKYGMRILGFPGAGIDGVTVRKVLAWQEKQFVRTATRWQLDGC